MEELNDFIKIIKEHIEYRQQLFKLAKADLVKTYRGAALGWSWAIIKPVVTIFVYWFAFEIGLRSGRDVNGYPFFLWLISGLIPWFYISDMLTVIMLIIYILFGFKPDAYWLQLIFFIFLSFIIWTLWSLFSSLLAAISKDFGNLVKSFVTAVFWLSGILWNPETVKIAWLKKALEANPVTYIVNGYRNCLINKIWFWEQPKRLVYFMISTFVMLILALWAYRKVRKDIPDVL